MLRNFLFILIVTIFSSHVFAKPLKVGITAGPNEILMKYAATLAKEKYNLEVKPIVFTNYQLPNEALNSNDIDANFFQTQEFLDASIAAKNYKIKAVAKMFIYPMGIYSKKINALEDLKNKAVVIIPNDASNQSRALILLQNAGLIKLNESKKGFYTVRDIQENTKNLKIISLNTAQMPHHTMDADILLLNNDFVLSAKFKFEDSLFNEKMENAQPYINVIATSTQNSLELEIKQLISILQSKEFEEKTYTYYPNALKVW